MGKYMTEESQFVGQRTEELTQQISGEKFVKEGRKDILTTALGKDEQPERARGVEMGLGIKAVFDSSSRSKCRHDGFIFSKDQIKDMMKDVAVQAGRETLAILFGTFQPIGIPQPDVQKLAHLLSHLEYPPATMPSPQPNSARSSCGDPPPHDQLSPSSRLIKQKKLDHTFPNTK